MKRLLVMVPFLAINVSNPASAIIRNLTLVRPYTMR